MRLSPTPFPSEYYRARRAKHSGKLASFPRETREKQNGAPNTLWFPWKLFWKRKVLGTLWFPSGLPETLGQAKFSLCLARGAAIAALHTCADWIAVLWPVSCVAH